MNILRIQSLTIIDSSTVDVVFTDKLDTNISSDNISIESQSDAVPAPLVLGVNVFDKTLTIKCQPLTPFASYIFKFQSTDLIPFKSLNGTSIISNDGVSNQYLVIAPIESDNEMHQFLVNYLRDNVYNVEDQSTFVSKIIQSLATLGSKALYDIRQVKNENYLSFDVFDELKTRGNGPYDRLDQECAYEIIRVAKTPTNTVGLMDVNVDNFYDYPITLLSETASEVLLPSSTDIVGYFNINSLKLNVSNKNVSKLKSITFIFSDGNPNYTYDIETLGYQILDSRYDQDYAFSYLTLENNQFKLNDEILSDSLFSLNIVKLNVSYEYKNLGRSIDANSVAVDTVINVIREELPPIENVFNLKKAPVVDSNGDISGIGGLTFADPNALDSSTPHPAFKYEIVFNLAALPARPGEYSVDYETGTVYVFGEDLNYSGTGALPPLVSYSYKYTFKSQIDYVYDESLKESVALPYGNLINNKGHISFNYEQVLVPGEDYNLNLHKEVLNERIENRVVALNALKLNHSPITNVFRIYNETSGEIYPATRWSNDKVYFNYNTPPKTLQNSFERVSFKDVLNELLYVDSTLTNSYSTKIYKFLLMNNNISASSEDCIGSFINTSVSFSNLDVFSAEKYFEKEDTELQNIDRLNVGEYFIDYSNGIVYCAVVNDQSFNVGTVSYKNTYINPQYPHLISVDDIYYQIDFANPKNKTFSYSSFGEGFIIPKDLDFSNETSYKDYVYQLSNNTVGVFAPSFVDGLANNIKYLRGVYEYTDLKNNKSPINFSEVSTFDTNVVSVNSIEKQEYSKVAYDGYNFYVDVDFNLQYQSANITIDVSVVRITDSAELWDISGVIENGSRAKLILSGVNAPVLNDPVVVNYSFTINNLSRIVVDYNKGDLYVDYSYLADEIIVSYEYGDNVVDFRQSTTVNEGQQYYVSYRVGALRDSLLKNFGSLVNIPELTSFDIDLNRERYRDAVSAALESFIQGPTVPAIKNIVNKIAHIEPEIIESSLQNWSLGSSLLYPKDIETNGEFSLIPAKYGNGVLINEDNQTITFPGTSNLRIEEGSFETWIIPQWNGIDNDAELTFTITKDGYSVNEGSIFIGSLEFHPEYDFNNQFKVSKKDNVLGKPNKNKDGIYIYNDLDSSGLFNRWYVDVVDGYTFGNVDLVSTKYNIKITTDGLFYDVKSSTTQPSNMSITSGNKSINLTITDTAAISEGIYFIADREHYILDFGDKLNRNRISLYKDPSGYVNFRIFDKNANAYSIGADVSSWKAQEKHHIAISWTLNSIVNRDEMHLFIDGQEVPNINKYSSKISPYLHEKFRTIAPEEIAGSVIRPIVGYTDLTTINGSNVVSSSIQFGSYNILPGDIIYIDENGFNPAGYTITSISAGDLTLASTMPVSITNGKFSVNKTSITVNTPLDVYSNVAVSTISYILTGTDMQTTSGSYDVISTIDFDTVNVVPGYLLRINNSNLDKHYIIEAVSGTTLTLNGLIPYSLTNQEFFVYPNEEVEIPGQRALRPSYAFSKDGYYNDVLTLTNSVSENDLIYIKTLGLNNKRIIQKYYQWGDSSNIILTTLPPPVSLDGVGIYHILLDKTLINAANSTLTVNDFVYSTTSVNQPSLSDNGRTLEISISSGNLDFTNPLNIDITGLVNAVLTTETVSFSDVGKLNTINRFSSITNVQVSGTVLNTLKSFVVVSIKEAYSVLIPEDSNTYPVLRYSYPSRNGYSMSGVGTNVITDSNGYFNGTDIGNYIVISYPPAVAGTYKITNVSVDRKSLTVDTTLASFTDGVYVVYNVSNYRSGFQNGFFIFEQAQNPGQAYSLNQGLYEFDYFTYLSIKTDPINEKVYIGSDFNGKANVNAVIDEIKTTINMLSDVRVGETPETTDPSITKDFNSLKELKSDQNTLMLCHFDVFPFKNEADYYLRTKNKHFVQSGNSINDLFSKSISIKDKPIIIDNEGILNSSDSGTIEFWVNPQFDTENDPNYRFYFDATGVVTEKVVSIDNATVKVSGNASKIISVKLFGGDSRIDYFAGGYLEIDTANAISENTIALTVSSVSVSKEISQVISVKILNDPTNTDYFANGVVGSDKKTIYFGKNLPVSGLDLVIIYKPKNITNNIKNEQVIRLKKRLPSQKATVEVSYIPSGMQGDRISIYKDNSGYLNFTTRAANVDYQIRAPISWSGNTWHRVKATFKFNKGKTTDEIRLFVDGYEYANALFGSGLLFGDNYVFGSSYSGFGGIKADIKFKDFINQFYIGSEYNGNSPAYALIDNLRISNISRPIFTPFGDSIDVNYNSNTSAAFPVKSDLYTTLLLDFDDLLTKADNFALLQNKKAGIFTFDVNVFDSFDIVNSNAKVKQILEKLIKTLKPASSSVYINYK